METNSLTLLLEDPGMAEILESFLVETKEILDKLDTDLVLMEHQPDDKELLNQVFRHFHTIKGTAGFFGLERLPVITHTLEDILNKLRKDELKLNSFIMDAILKATDTIKSIIEKVESEHNEDVDINEDIELLNNALIYKEGSDFEPHDEDARPLKTEIKVSAEPAKAIIAEKTIRVDIERLDELLNITSELVLGRNRLFQVSSETLIEYEGTKISRDLSDITKQIDFMTNELQLIVMKTRMVKIGKMFNKFPRLIRDLHKETGKEVNLILKGEDTELDKTIIEEINDPLVHLVRNSVDHGIESPQERIRKGKNPTGTIILSAEQEGNNIVITIQDDGKGIDADQIKELAIKKGIISKEKSNELNRQEIMNLIFLPGFSTKELVSNLSGRGVGMDVVKTNVTKLRGIIQLDSVKGEGTTVKIKLPLTLAIIPGMIVRTETEKIVIPLNNIIEVLKLKEESVYSINQHPVIKLRDEIIPLIDIHSSIYKQVDEQTHKCYAVVVGIAEKKFGILVDELIGQKEIVIKPLGNYLGTVKGIAGSTILGDGSVIMILDVGEIITSIIDSK